VRRLSIAVSLALSAVAAVASAQQGSFEVTSLAGALDLRGRLERSGEHGCSQSFASSSDQATLALTVDARGAATLAIDLEHRETFGPSPGRYAQGDHEFTHTTELARVVMTGRAARTGSELEVRFDRVARSSVRFTGYGTLPLPPATTTALTGTLRCRLAPIDVMPSQWSDGEVATQSALLQCAWDGGAPAPLDALDAPAFALGRGPGVRTVSAQHMWDHTPARAFRRMP
jgi:hypothetical protein